MRITYILQMDALAEVPWLSWSPWMYLPERLRDLETLSQLSGIGAFFVAVVLLAIAWLTFIRRKGK